MSYGRNFEVINPPHGRDRRGRFFLDGAATAIGAPGSYGTGGTVGGPNDLDMLPVEAVSGDVAPTELSGIMIYEYGPNAYAGDDPVLTDYSDKGDIPAGAAIQLIRGENIKVRFRNTAAETFLNSRSYAARTMVDLTGIVVGDTLQPEATPNDTNGYWQETVTPGNEWLIVTSVDTARNELEAQMVF